MLSKVNTLLSHTQEFREKDFVNGSLDAKCLCNDKKLIAAAKSKVFKKCGLSKSLGLLPVVNSVCGTNY